MKRIFFLSIVFLFLFNIVYSLNEFTIMETENITIVPEVFDPDNDNIKINFSSPIDNKGFWQTNYGDAGIYNITIKVSDGLDVVVENVLLNVLRKEEAPVITKVDPNTESLDIKEGDIINFLVEASDLNKDILNYTWYLNGEFVSDTKQIRFKPGFKDNGDYDLKVEITDGKTVVSRSWDISVQDVDRAPEFFPIEQKKIRENEYVEVNLSAIDRDDDLVSFSAENLPEGAVLLDNKFSWNPDFDAVKKESFIDSVLDKFHILEKTFKIRFFAHSKSLNSSQVLFLTVASVNRPPRFVSLGDIFVKEGESFEIVPNATDPDGDKLNYKFSGWINSPVYQTNFDDSGEHVVIVTVTDGEFYVSKNLTVKVENMNQKPFLKQVKSISAKEDEDVRIKVEADDADFDDISFSLDEESSKKGMIIKYNTLKWIPDFDTAKRNESPKEIKFKVTASDGSLSDVQESFIKVEDVNREPEISSVNPSEYFFTYPNKAIAFEVSAEDLDKDKLQYTWNTGFMQTYKGAPKLKMKFSSLGKKKITVVVSDGEIKKEFTWNVHVINPPKKPKMVSIK